MAWLTQLQVRAQTRQAGIALCAITVVVGGALHAQDPPKEQAKDDAVAARRIAELKREAATYRIVRDDGSGTALLLREEPLLRWTNPLRSTEDGAVFLWTAEGRPEAIASLYRYRREGILAEDHEFQSLATTPLSGTREGQTFWAPRTPGIVFAAIPGAPKPAATAAERTRQLRDLAREFHASFDLDNDHTDLRLLAKPLYRYESKPNKVLDGALFAFVQTTDPEVLLLIEARPINESPAWQYAFARSSMVNVRGQHKDRTVWQVGWAYQLTQSDQPYITIPAAEQPR
jgi:hypothetical protein